jgi:hypothetical protein
MKELVFPAQMEGLREQGELFFLQTVTIPMNDDN